MSCPSCGSELAAGQSRCAGCGALVAPPAEGALAPKPEPLRELPGLRRKDKEKTWRDEVNERVRSRKKRRDAETGLPLFDGLEDAGPPSEREPASTAEAWRPGPAGAGERANGEAEAGPGADAGNTPLAESAEEATFDLPLRRDDPSPEPGNPTLEPAAAPVRHEEEVPLELQPPPPVSRPVERPARFAERFQAGAVDGALLALVFGLVLYFASRAARVDLMGLRPAWPWLAGYLSFLGLVYAAYFTGTTGQTLGKMFVGLRVVDTAGQPPSYPRAFLRAALAVLGLAAAGLGMAPMAFDPAHRALHDRVFRTRVVRG